MITATVLNPSVSPNQSSRGAPSSPFRPNAVSSATPAIVGGSTIGRSMSASTAPFPGKRACVSQYATGVPATTAITSATADVHSESASASSAVLLVIASQVPLPPIPRSNSPANGSTKNTAKTAMSSANPAWGARARSAVTGSPPRP